MTGVTLEVWRWDSPVSEKVAHYYCPHGRRETCLIHTDHRELIRLLPEQSQVSLEMENGRK